MGALIARRRDWPVAAACAIAGALPDIDFLLPLQHRGPSHSLSAAALAFAASLAVLSMGAGSIDRVRLAAALAMAYASHTVLDWLGADSSSPRGVMMLWPMSNSFYVSGLDVFNAVERRYWLPGFWTRNALALLRELLILAPVVLISVAAGRRVHSYRQRGAGPPPA